MDEVDEENKLPHFHPTKMKKSIPYIIAITFLILFLWSILRKPSGHDQALKAERDKTQSRVDSVAGLYQELLREKDSAAFQLFKKTQEHANRMEGEAVIWKQRYNEEKKRKTGIVSNRAYDSLLNGLYTGQP